MATTTMNISLPDSMRTFVEERLNGYGSASEYVRDLIRADKKRREQDDLERLLLERIRSDKKIEFDMADVKKKLAKRIRERGK